MNKHARYLAHGALIGAMYAALTHLQNLLLPGSATWAIQALCVLALFTPAAIPGMTVGCFVFNLTYLGALPLDIVVGTLASFLSAVFMRLTRKYPLVALSMPAVFNAILVGWELTAYIGGGFWLNALYVAIGEMAVCYTLGLLLYKVLKTRNLGARVFGELSH